MYGRIGKLNRFLAMLLSILMLISALPVSALAETEKPTDNTSVVESTPSTDGEETDGNTDGAGDTDPDADIDGAGDTDPDADTDGAGDTDPDDDSDGDPDADTDGAGDTDINSTAQTLGVTQADLSLSRAFDIKIVDAADSSRVYAPQGDVTVSITLVNATLTDYADVHVLHFAEDDYSDTFTVQHMASTVAENTVTFTTDSFSVYTVDATTHVRTYYFYTFDEYLDYVPYYMNTDIGTEESQTYMQIVREGETPVAPQNPVNPQDQEATFSGWYLGSANTTDGPSATIPFTFSAVPQLTGDEQVHLYAKFSRYTYVIFHDQFVELNAATHEGTYPVAFTRRLDLSSEQESDWYVDVTQYSVSFQDPEEEDDNAMVFIGWSPVPIKTPGARLNDDGDTVTQVTTQNGRLYATENIHLYPIFQAVKWISFYALLMAVGMMLPAVMPRRRRRRKEE